MNSNGETLVSDVDHVQLERLVTEAAWRVDEGPLDTLYELFVADGMLLLGDSEPKGRDAIKLGPSTRGRRDCVSSFSP